MITRDRYEQTGRDSATPPFDPGQAAVPEHPEMVWQDGPGPGYSDELAEQLVSHRYDAGIRLLTATLPIPPKCSLTPHAARLC